MNHTAKQNSFEKVSFRALIVITFLCVIFGGGTAFIQYHNAQDYYKFHDEYKKQNDRRDTLEFNNCLESAIHSNDENEVSRCYKIFAPDIEELQRLTNAALNANHWVSIGLVMLITPIPLFIIYFLLRWTITGRWKQIKE